ncbi:MAG: DedA family protein [Pirellulales bacterium]|nr:DedA family protein [Pirellulales bacterium]
MENFSDFIDLFLHLDKELKDIVQVYGTWIYLILFAIIFCETGLVVTPILPGDSLLFAAGAMAAKPERPLSAVTLILLLSVAAILGDAVNYAIGWYMGPKVLTSNGRFLKREYLEKTHRFYERYGGKTIILARFVPIVRTFAPFLAGVGSMSYVRFASYNVVGGIVWVVFFVILGYAFGNIPIVERYFEFVIIGIVFVSILPAVFEAWRARREAAAG